VAAGIKSQERGIMREPKLGRGRGRQCFWGLRDKKKTEEENSSG